jgi:hypothetical protein
MSLAMDLTACQQRLQEAGQKASEEMRKLKSVAAPTIYAELQLHLCNVASEVNKLKVLLGSLRMIGELEQRPPAVTAESLELFQGGERSSFAKASEEKCPHHLLLASLHRAGDHTLDEVDLSDRVDGEEEAA